MTLGFAFGMGSGNKFFTEMLPALRVSDKALERQEVRYFQPCSGERSMVYGGGAQRVRLTRHVCRTTLAPYQEQNQMSNHRQSSS